MAEGDRLAAGGGEVVGELTEKAHPLLLEQPVREEDRPPGPLPAHLEETRLHLDSDHLHRSIEAVARLEVVGEGRRDRRDLS